jgi:membrane-bound ClpP family serine protease
VKLDGLCITIGYLTLVFWLPTPGKPWAFIVAAVWVFLVLYLLYYLSKTLDALAPGDF